VAWTSRPALLLPALIGLGAAPARAEGERALSVGLGWATFSTVGEATGNMEPPAIAPDIGGALAVTYEHALSTDLSLRAEIAGGVFYGGAEDGAAQTSYAGLADAGVVFRFDVLRYVPYAFGGIGAIVTAGGPLDGGGQLVLAIGGGLDVLASRDRSWGIEARLASFGGDVTIFTLGVRATTRWGYF
jgi:hypothetical protein